MIDRYVFIILLYKELKKKVSNDQRVIDACYCAEKIFIKASAFLFFFFHFKENGWILRKHTYVYDFIAVNSSSDECI